MIGEQSGFWLQNWLWGVPLVAATVLLHAFGLGAIVAIVRRILHRHVDRAHHEGALWAFSSVVGVTTLLLAVLHGAEAILWGAVYAALGVVPDLPTAIYHSLLVITTLGSNVETVASHWRLLGGIEAIGGWLTFGLSTAFLFAVMERMGPLARRG
jgi:hypothetical protein